MDEASEEVLKLLENNCQSKSKIINSSKKTDINDQPSWSNDNNVFIRIKWINE